LAAEEEPNNKKKKKKKIQKRKVKATQNTTQEGHFARAHEGERDRDRAPLTTLLFRVGILRERERERESDGENLS